MSLLDSNIIVLSLLQTAKGQLELLMQMAQSSSSTELMVTMAETFTKTVEAAMKIRQKIEVAEPVAEPVAESESVAEVMPALEAAVAAEAAVAPKAWSVHDCHTHLKGKDKGIWARVAVANGTYGICVGPSKDSKETANEKVIGEHGEVIVSKRRWANAKGISVGDTLFMGDTHIKKVFKGTVAAQPVAGPFCPLGHVEDSFIASLGPVTDERLAREVEFVFKVSWEEVGPLTEEWYSYLGTGRIVTVSPLTAAPPA